MVERGLRVSIMRRVFCEVEASLLVRAAGGGQWDITSARSFSSDFPLALTKTSALLGLFIVANEMNTIFVWDIFALVMNSSIKGLALCSSVSSTNVRGLAPSLRLSSFWNNKRL